MHAYIRMRTFIHAYECTHTLVGKRDGPSTMSGTPVSHHKQTHINIHTCYTQVWGREAGQTQGVERPSRIILVRHGESQGNSDENVYGRISDWRISLTNR